LDCVQVSDILFITELLWVLLYFDNLVHGFLGNFPQVDRLGGSDQFLNLFPVGWGVFTHLPNFLDGLDKDLSIVIEGVSGIEDEVSCFIEFAFSLWKVA
jgi:hypothetical protein